MLLTKGYVGNQEVSRIYLGNNLVWEKDTPVLDPSTQAVLDYAIDNEYELPTTQNIEDIDTLVRGLKSIGVWGKLDVLFVFANTGGESFKSINYIDPEHSGAAYLLNSQKHGFLGNGSSGSYFDTQFNPSVSGNNYQLNSASRGAYIYQTSMGNHIVDSASGNTNLIFNSNVNSHRINSGTSGIVSGNRDMSGLGYKAINRSGSNEIQLYNEKTQLVDTRGSSSIANAPQFIFRFGSNYSSAGISVYYMGGSLTETEHNNLSDAIEDYLALLGPFPPTLDVYEINAIQGSIQEATATPPDGSTIIWKDSQNNVVHAGNVYSIPTDTVGIFTYYAYSVNSSQVESDPVEVSIEVNSIDNVLLVTPIHTYAEEGEDVTITPLVDSSIALDYYDSDDNLIQTDGDLVLTGLSIGTHTFTVTPRVGSTEYASTELTIIVVDEFPTIDFDTHHTLTINTGVNDSLLIYNEEVQPNSTRIFPKNTVINNIALQEPTLKFSPKATSVIMDSDKTINFTENGD